MAEDIIIPVAAFALAFGIIYVIFSTRHRERMAMIDKEVDPKAFMRTPIENHNALIKWSLLLVGVGLGFFVGNMFDTYTMLEEGPAYFGSVFLFGGLGLLLSYLILKGEKNKE